MDSGADRGWLIARVMDAADNTSTTQTVHFDSLSANGALAPGVLDATVPRLGIGRTSLRTIGPNLHVLTTSKWLSASGSSSTYVTIVGCR
jgi:hypothetical protein